ncbi:amino acid permease 6-like [Lycium barbarum]|uniref:amino acid permease 6-like n=1 Tax=Lycium barbarum TaxID=112863 RepID=UPI00293E6886|nr:amino acid permease 6-like [Lycium barbarum]
MIVLKVLYLRPKPLAKLITLLSSSTGLCMAASVGQHVKTSITGTVVGVDVSASQKPWRSLQAIGDIAFAYAFATILIEIQFLAAIISGHIENKPAENKTMKRASLVGVFTTTFFYALCGTISYAAFGNDAPGNFLTGFGFYEPFWLIDFANVFCQPIYGFVEARCSEKWLDNKFITSQHAINIPWFGVYYANYFRMLWMTAYVVVTAVIAMIFPFFNAILGLIGAASFYPLTVYFPIAMHIAQRKIPKYSGNIHYASIPNKLGLVISILISSFNSISVSLLTLSFPKSDKAGGALW